MKVYCCIDYMLDFDTYGPDDRCYLRREDAEKRAERIKRSSEYYNRRWASVHEMELVIPHGHEEMLLEDATAKNGELLDLVHDMWQWMCRARYDRSVRDDEMDEMGVRAARLGIPDYELGIEVTDGS